MIRAILSLFRRRQVLIIRLDAYQLAQPAKPGEDPIVAALKAGFAEAKS